MNHKDNEIVGYSAYHLEHQFYNIDSLGCYIAESPEKIHAVIEKFGKDPADYRIDAVTFDDIANDLGETYGDYALKPVILKRFLFRNDFIIDVMPFFLPGATPDPDIISAVIDKIPQPEISQDMTIPVILNNFRLFNETYQRKSVDAAIYFKEEITPHLINILEGVIDDPYKYMSEDSLFDHNYALMLLGHFKEPSAHRVILDLLRLKGEMLDILFGEIITENLPAILVNTCGGSIDLIKSFILDKDLYVYCRAAACQALAYATVYGYVDREDVVAFFGSLFTGGEAVFGSDFWSFLTCTVCEMHPGELLDTIKLGYDRGLINSGVITYENVKNDAKADKEQCLNRLIVSVFKNGLSNIHYVMSEWGCFVDDDDDISETSKGILKDPYPGDLAYLPGNSDRKLKKEKKKKRKQTKASKKKNRR